MPADRKLKVLIGPHAGVDQSGETAAWAYKNMAAHVNEIDRVMILGPSHKFPLTDIGITTYDEW